MKKSLIFFIILVLAIAIGITIFLMNSKDKSSSVSLCKINKMTFYYLESCTWCQKIKSEGTLEKIQELGVKVKKVNVGIIPVSNVTSVPTFSINGKLYVGYKTFEELKNLLGCPSN